MEFTITINFYYIALIVLGFGLGYLCLAGVGQQRETKLDHMKHDLEVNKEWLRMMAVKQKADLKNGKNNVIRRL